MATMASATAPTTSAAITTTPVASTASAAWTTASARTTITTPIRTAITGGLRRRLNAVEIRFVAFLKFGSAFDSQRRSAHYRTALAFGLRRPAFCEPRRNSATAVCRSGSCSAHFCALLFQNSFAREANAIALDGEYFHQHLIAFFQLVANIFNAMLRDFADVQ